ncbi:MAG: hypothetical protein IVW57_12700 [Ktedonobacterales bacterium]|nr:hypothetical protein [Ktedonobacterales bacterium]
MGKYKQWLHHQEIGRRLRDQINTLEQERARVQQMAPTHQTSLPDLENPLVAALLAYTRAGSKLSNIDVIKAAIPDIGPDPVKTVGTPASSVGAASSGGAGVVSSLMARADSMASDPLQQMQDLSRPQESAPSGTQPRAGSSDSVGGWWQQHRHDGKD